MVAFKRLSETGSPHISEERVKFALDALLYGVHPRQPNPLEDLLLVDDALLNSSLPRGTSNRNYILSHILISTISNELIKHRCAMGLANSVAETSRAEVQHSIAGDAKSGNAELLGWSWLYYHYVRVDLDISVDLFCRISSIDQRTLQRYRQHAIWRLMFRLIDREQVARKKFQKQRLYTQLPASTPTLLYGRDADLKWVDDSLRLVQSSLIEVVGAGGIGKTAFVQYIIRSLIDSEAIEFLLWFDKPTSIREIRQRLAILVHEQEYCGSVREFIHWRQTAVVIDGLESLGSDLDDLESILGDLGTAVVFLTSYEPIPVRNVAGFLVLAELELYDAEQLIHALLNKWRFKPSESLTADNVEAIWMQTGGNPRLIEREICELQMQRAHYNRDSATPYP